MHFIKTDEFDYFFSLFYLTLKKHQSRLQQMTNMATTFLIFEKNKV